MTNRTLQLQDYDIETRYRASVVGSDRISGPETRPEVREITIDVEGPRFSAEVGQNIGVLAPGRREIGQSEHFRLYSIAGIPEVTETGGQRLRICVRRCSYIDLYSGERYPGVASNYLCDLRPGDALTVTGPYGQAFELPPDPKATLLLIGAGTGIAPFRAFVKQIYARHPDFAGRILLFHGGETGIDLLYRNRERDDFALYYDQETFEAIDALAKRPGWSDTVDWESALKPRGERLAALLSDPHTYVYLAGLAAIRDELDQVFAEVAGSNRRWHQRKAELQAEGRWTELLY